MKIIAICFTLVTIFLVGIISAFRPNLLDDTALNRSRGLSSWLTYSIEFHPAKVTGEASFVATLTNASPYSLRIAVNDRKFHAGFTVKSADQKEFRVFDREYHGLLLTSAWSEPRIVLASRGSISWSVPLSSLVSERDSPITEHSLLGCEVISEMVLTVEPRILLRGFVEGNATKVSNAIHIQEKEPNKGTVGNAVGRPTVCRGQHSGVHNVTPHAHRCAGMRRANVSGMVSKGKGVSRGMLRDRRRFPWTHSCLVQSWARIAKPFRLPFAHEKVLNDWG